MFTLVSLLNILYFSLLIFDFFEKIILQKCCHGPSEGAPLGWGPWCLSIISIIVDPSLPILYQPARMTTHVMRHVTQSYTNLLAWQHTRWGMWHSPKPTCSHDNTRDEACDTVLYQPTRMTTHLMRHVTQSYIHCKLCVQHFDDIMNSSANHATSYSIIFIIRAYNTVNENK